MKIYETTFIINPQTDDAGIEKQVKSISDHITSNGGKIIRDDHMGTRRLAYEIKGLTQGYYAGFIFESPPDLIAGLDLYYRQNEEYLRHLTIAFPGTIEELEKSRTVTETSDRDRGGYNRRGPAHETSAPRPPARRRPDQQGASSEPAAPAAKTDDTPPSAPKVEEKPAVEAKPAVSDDQAEEL